MALILVGNICLERVSIANYCYYYDKISHYSLYDIVFLYIFLDYFL